MDAMHVNRFRCYFDDLSKVRFNPDIDLSEGVPVTIYDDSVVHGGQVSSDSVVVIPSAYVVDVAGDLRDLDESILPKQEHFTLIDIH